MIKPTPNPPESAPSAADIHTTLRTPSTMYTLDPHINIEDLLGHACESLASAHVMTMDLADRTYGTSLNTLLGIAQVIMLAELNVNRALDQLDSPT